MVSPKPVPITKVGLERLQEELEELLSEKRPAAAALIHENREESPGSQNEGEYEEAKNEQAFIEARIREIRGILVNAQIIDETHAKDTSIVHLGATVTVTIKRKRQKFTIVGIAEVNPSEGFVSDESPVGRALLGRSKGDTVEVDAPAGKITMRIKEIG